MIVFIEMQYLYNICVGLQIYLIAIAIVYISTQVDRMVALGGVVVVCD